MCYFMSWILQKCIGYGLPDFWTFKQKFFEVLYHSVDDALVTNDKSSF